jgi:ABC-type Fe3+/spermidine/putrescine transport system ATPase subunit
MSGESLHIEDLVVTYGGPEEVLKGVSLAIEAGEFIALLGASGCGKTTLLRAVSGFAAVESGRVRMGGRDITHLAPDKRNMAMVFQSYALWPHMTVAENIGYGLKLRRHTRDDIGRQVGDMLDMLGLTGLGGRKVTQLSGGQRQRVALGRALAIKPQILLLDEPLSNLDARIRQAVRHEIKTIQGRLGITAIHVTHDREEAMVMADRIVILEGGEILQQGTPEDVYNRPATPFVAAFMGADNIVRLTAKRTNGTVCIPAGEFNDEARLPEMTAGGEEGVHIAGPAEGAIHAHFRSEAARILETGETPPKSLVLRGHITQSSYPGGFFRYAVEVGEGRYMVDDERRFTVGADVGICLQAKALHLYPAE